MGSTSEVALLLALETGDEVFKNIQEMLSSDNYLKVLMVVDEDKRYADMAEDAGVSEGTISNALDELQELGLVEETDEGYQRTLSVLGHPMVQHIFWEEVDVDA